MQSLVSDVDDTLRAELRLLHEGLMSDAGLEPALQEFVEATRLESGIDVELEIYLSTEPAEVPRTALYRAVREGITNARKHSGATRIEIRIEEREGVINATVDDNGAGARGKPGLGLTTTRERLEAIGGGLSVRARRSGGTAYRVWVPFRIEETP